MTEPVAEAEKDCLRGAMARIDKNLAVLVRTRGLLGEHMKGPAADDLQQRLRWREKQVRAVREDLQQLLGTIDAAVKPRGG